MMAADDPDNLADAPQRAGDPNSRDEQFVRLFGLNQGRVFGFIVTLLPDRNDAEEVLQRTSIILWRKFPEFDLTADFVRWACGIAQRQTLNFLRERRRAGHAFDELLIEQLAATRLAQGDALEDRRRALRKCQEKLAASDRQILQHYYYGGKVTAAEVGRQLGRPTNTVLKALIRIRRELYRCIDRTLASEARR